MILNRKLNDFPKGKDVKVNLHGQIDSKAKWNEKHIAEEYYYRDPRIH